MSGLEDTFLFIVFPYILLGLARRWAHLAVPRDQFGWTIAFEPVVQSRACFGGQVRCSISGCYSY